MSRGPYPIMLMLAMALPGAVRALGLGEIRVDSALNEPLSAQIEIVGATRDELMALTAKVAAREIFQRYGADRPGFLTTATFKVGLDSQGHPVLNVRSGEAFTDPLVHFLVDLRWGSNDLIRDYSLLLDPAGFNSARNNAEAAQAGVAEAAQVAVAQALPAPPGAGAEAATTPAATTAAPAAATHASLQPNPFVGPLQHRITARDTLRGIARRSGARSESQVQRTMIAIFRANPAAFDGNINRLHRGASLTLPTATQVAAISTTDAKREVRSQMTAWRLGGRASTSPRDAAARLAPMSATALTENASPAAAESAAPDARLPAPAPAPAPAAADAGHPQASLQARVEFLEQALQDMHRQLAVHNAKFRDLDAAPAAGTTSPVAGVGDASQTESPPDAGATPLAAAAAAAAAPGPLSGSAFLGPIAAGVTLLLAGFASVRRRRRSPLNSPVAMIEAAPVANPEVPPAVAVAAAESARAAPAGADVKAALGHTADAVATHAVAHDAVAAGAAAALSTTVSAPQLAPDPAPPRPSEPAPRVAAKTKSRSRSDQPTAVLEVDTVALERSYLDSLGIDTTTLDDTLETTLNTASLDATVISREAARTPPTADTNSTVPLTTLDLEATVEHVQMPSGLNDRAVVSERRANIVDALKTAIDRDPHRGDLRMKLLETYFTATLNSRRAFMDSVRKLARERDQVSAEDWLKVVEMGREIAADDLLFSDSPLDQPPRRLADCA
jgi:pilus assembly protein FimV